MIIIALEYYKQIGEEYYKLSSKDKKNNYLKKW